MKETAGTRIPHHGGGGGFGAGFGGGSIGQRIGNLGNGPIGQKLGNLESSVGKPVDIGGYVVGGSFGAATGVAAYKDHTPIDKRTTAGFLGAAGVGAATGAFGASPIGRFRGPIIGEGTAGVGGAMIGKHDAGRYSRADKDR